MRATTKMTILLLIKNELELKVNTRIESLNRLEQLEKRWNIEKRLFFKQNFLYQKEKFAIKRKPGLNPPSLSNYN